MKPKREVSFSFIEIHEFKIGIGDNPAVSAGAPIALGKPIEKTSKVDVEKYECLRERVPRLHKDELILSREDREALLLKNGYKRQDIVAAIRQARKDRDRRANSFTTRNYDCINERLEGGSRKVLKIIGVRHSSKHLYTPERSAPGPVKNCRSGAGAGAVTCSAHF